MLWKASKAAEGPREEETHKEAYGRHWTKAEAIAIKTG